MARSTPAQNDRGDARRIVRARHARPHRSITSRTDALRRASADEPVPGRAPGCGVDPSGASTPGGTSVADAAMAPGPGASTTVRTTARGRSPAMAAAQAESWSTTRAPASPTVASDGPEVERTAPTATRWPSRRSSWASRVAEGSRRTSRGLAPLAAAHSSSATTSWPGARSAPRRPAGPVTATGVPGDSRGTSARTAPDTESAPEPVTVAGPMARASTPVGTRTITGSATPTTPVHEAPQRADREDQPVQVVVDVEVAGEAGAGEPRLVPGAVRSLRCG